MADSPLVSFLSQVNSVLEVQGRQPWDFVALFASGTDVVCRVGDVLGLPSTEGGGPERRSMVFLLIHRKAMFQAPGAWGPGGPGGLVIAQLRSGLGCPLCLGVFVFRSRGYTVVRDGQNSAASIVTKGLPSFCHILIHFIDWGVATRHLRWLSHSQLELSNLWGLKLAHQGVQELLNLTVKTAVQAAKA